eukprot:TRINITY_DN851_c0_g1_i17.p2 TRINITY_DN851_c0_g1~~TRINITY_DN851_c0_g1_i17.p2  ORF type:complete len:172 (+),score=51.43 TRINITY_DN851_c0_g1_i17:605-1120(+)
MTSAFLDGLGELVIEEGVVDAPEDEAFGKVAGKLGVRYMFIGKGCYWTSEKMTDQLTEVINILERKYPWAQFLFLFDNSSNHLKLAPGALNAKTMNVKTGGNQLNVFPLSITSHHITPHHTTSHHITSQDIEILDPTPSLKLNSEDDDDFDVEPDGFEEDEEEEEEFFDEE